jgi:hypothetical protein
MGSAPESPEISRAREGGTVVSEMTGRIISHYKILEKHGGDGMGVVHRTKGTERGPRQCIEVPTGRAGRIESRAAKAT